MPTLSLLKHHREVSFPEAQTYLVIYIQYIRRCPLLTRCATVRAKEALVDQIDEKFEESMLVYFDVHGLMSLHEGSVFLEDCLEIEDFHSIVYAFCRSYQDYEGVLGQV